MSAYPAILNSIIIIHRTHCVSLFPAFLNSDTAIRRTHCIYVFPASLNSSTIILMDHHVCELPAFLDFSAIIPRENHVSAFSGIWIPAPSFQNSACFSNPIITSSGSISPRTQPVSVFPVLLDSITINPRIYTSLKSTDSWIKAQSFPVFTVSVCIPGIPVFQHYHSKHSSRLCIYS